jgi:hypothetical protein
MKQRRLERVERRRPLVEVNLIGETRRITVPPAGKGFLSGLRALFRRRAGQR